VRVLVIAAHTDDEVLGVGGTIAKHVQQGDEVYVVSVCDRATDHKYDQAIISRLREHTLQAADILGIKEVLFCGEKDEQLTVLEGIKAIEPHVEAIRPDIIYTHHRGDSNQDHRIAFEATLVVARTTMEHVAKKVLCYEVPSSTDQAPPFADYVFVPNVFVNIEDTLAKKVEAFELFESELGTFPHPRSSRALKVRAEYWGTKVGLGAAEAFELVREVVG
jgi:LmbE family N-acetylglucosaminyl deacetylase